MADRNAQEYAAGNRVRMEIVDAENQPKDPWFVQTLDNAREVKALLAKNGYTVYLFNIDDTGKLTAVQN